LKKIKRIEMKKVFLVAIFSILPLMLHAVQAYQGNITFRQHDGSSFKGTLQGDEWFHWIEDKQGNIIVYNRRSKQYEYAKLKKLNGQYDLVPSGIKTVTNPERIKAFKNIQQIDRKILYDILNAKRNSALKHMSQQAND